MFNNAFIDIAIGLTLMYLVLSLVCTVINEWIATLLKLRSDGLRSGLQQLLDDPRLKKDFEQHGLIAGAREAVGGASSELALFNQFSQLFGKKKQPDALASSPPGSPPSTDAAGHLSYLSGETFALALVGSLDPKTPIPRFDDIQKAIMEIPDKYKIKSTLLAHLTTSQGDLDALRKNIATWFDDSMDRIGGAYKRQMKLISVLIGLIVAIIVNADTFKIGYALWSDNALRQQMTQAAGQTVQKGLPQNATPTDVTKGYKDVSDAVRAANEELRPLPIGWDSGPKYNPIPRFIAAWNECKLGLCVWIVLTSLVGWLVTGLALSLGAPFWFDTLSKFVNIRGAGVKPDRTDEKPAARQPPRAQGVTPSPTASPPVGSPPSH